LTALISQMRIRSKKRKHGVASIVFAACLITFSAALVRAQTQAVLRTFQQKNISTFRISLRIRTEIEGQKPNPIGLKTFLQPVSTWLEQNISWQATRTITSINSDGSAEIEEKLSNFSANTTTSDESAETKKLQADLESSLSKWSAPKTIQYRETRSGQISKLTGESVPPVDESSPRVLTAWLLRALRPTVALPPRPLNLGEHWQEPRVVQFAEWTATAGSEAGEWLAPPAGVRQRGEPTIKLETTQEITGAVTSGAEKSAEGNATAHFHAESLSTLALDDLRLMSASRSATRDILWTLAHVDGLEKSPQYRGRLFVEIGIQVCDETPCVTPNSNSGSGSH
jgi:hypothetical protein